MSGDPITRLFTDWNEGIIQLEVVRDVSGFDPAERNRIHMEVERNLAEEFLSVAGNLQLSSSLSLSSWIEQNPAGMADLVETAEAMQLNGSSYSKDFNNLTFRFSANLFPDFARIFIQHSAGYIPRPSMFYAPSAAYTGILIYARGEYPVYGEERKATLSQALFPRIWDEDMNLFFEPEMMASETLLENGTVCYASAADAPAVKDRVGPNPIRILARSLFGLVPTDPVIPRQDALSLLNSEKGRELLTRGRIAIITGD